MALPLAASCSSAKPKPCVKRKAPDAAEASTAVVVKQKSGADREWEYKQKAIGATFAGNPGTKEAKVWEKLQGKNRTLISLRKEFIEEFNEKGFGFVEGSKWSGHLDVEEFKQSDSFKTWSQILVAEANDEKNAQAKVRTAKAEGQGVPPPGDCKGWYLDPSREDEPVYKYHDNMIHTNKLQKIKGRQTTNLTGSLTLPMAAVVPKAIDAPPLMQLAAPATPPSPSTPAKAAECIKVPELMRNAESLLEKLHGQQVMSGFHASLKEALIAVKSVKGAPKQNYKSVQQLTAITELTQRVLNITEESMAAV